MLRKALFAAVVAVSIGGIARAELPPRGYVSLYADGARAYNAYCLPPAGYTMAKIDLWVWLLPGENGLVGADFAVAFPANVIRDRVAYNSAVIGTSSGNLSTGYSVSLNACQLDWCWIAHQDLYVSSLQGTSIEVVPHTGLGLMEFFTCAAGNPAEPCLRGTSLNLNSTSSPCLPPELAIGVEEPTWGGLKSLFGE